MDGAKDLFEQFESHKIDHIKTVVENGWSEDLLVEFKTADNNSGPMTSIDRKNLAKALSGFANSEGGIIVWGIGAERQQNDEPDIAKEFKPIKKLKLFLSDLLSYTPQMVSPTILNVIHTPIYEVEAEDIGYIVTFVPKGEGHPHMNMSRDEGRYYCRSGASFIRMEHYMVADRFSRRQQAKLEFFYELANGHVHDDVSVLVGVRNVGTGLALYPGLEITLGNNFHIDQYGLSGNTVNDQGLPRRVLPHDRKERTSHFFAGGSEYAIYPETQIIVTRFGGKVARAPVRIHYKLYCEGFSDSGEVEIPYNELAEYHRD